MGYTPGRRGGADGYGSAGLGVGSGKKSIVSNKWLIHFGSSHESGTANNFNLQQITRCDVVWLFLFAASRLMNME